MDLGECSFRLELPKELPSITTKNFLNYFPPHKERRENKEKCK